MWSAFGAAPKNLVADSKRKHSLKTVLFITLKCFCCTIVQGYSRSKPGDIHNEDTLRNINRIYAGIKADETDLIVLRKTCNLLDGRSYVKDAAKQYYIIYYSGTISKE